MCDKDFDKKISYKIDESITLFYSVSNEMSPILVTGFLGNEQ